MNEIGKLELLARQTQQLNKSAHELKLYGEPKYKSNKELIEEYRKREDIGMIQNLYATIKFYENAAKVKKYIA